MVSNALSIVIVIIDHNNRHSQHFTVFKGVCSLCKKTMKTKLLQLWPFVSNELTDPERQLYQDYLEQRRRRNCSSISSVATSIVSNVDSKKIKIKSTSTVTIVEHNLTIDEVSHKYNTSITNGLDEQEALDRLKKYGPNTFTPPKSKRWYLVLAREMLSGFAILLWFAGLASIGTFILDQDPQDVNCHFFKLFQVI